MRGVVFAGALAIAVAVGFALSGSGYTETYDRPIAQVSAEMLRTSVPRGMGSGLLALDDVKVETGPGHRVEWKFRRGQLHVGTLVAVAEARGDSRTTVTVSFDPGSANTKDQKVLDAQTFITTVGLPVMYETIDAKIEGRAVNEQIEEQAMAAYVKKNLSAIGRETQATFDEVGKELAESQSTSMSTTPMTPEEATEPSIKFNDEPESAADAARDASGGY